MKRIAKAFIVLFTIFIFFSYINIKGKEDKFNNLISSNEILCNSKDLSNDRYFSFDNDKNALCNELMLAEANLSLANNNFSKKQANPIDIARINDNAVSYIYNDCYITSTISNNSLDNNSITTSGFYISKNDMNYMVLVKKDNDEAKMVDSYEEFKEPGKYTITITTEANISTEKIVYVYSKITNYGYDYYFNNSMIYGDRVYANGDNNCFAVNSKLYIKKIDYLGIRGILKNETTNNVINISEALGDRYISLSSGDYSLNIVLGNSNNGEVLSYNYKFSISNKASKPGYNYNKLSNLREAKDLVLEHYELKYNSNVIVFSISNYDEAYKYAYKLENDLVEFKGDGSYYKDYNGDIIKYNDSLLLEEMISHYAKKRIEKGFFTDKNIAFKSYDKLYDNLNVLDNVYDSYIVPSDKMDSLYSSSFIINDFIFDYVSQYDSISINAYCHKNGSNYKLEYGIPIYKQLSVDSKYTITEANIYGYELEYDVYFYNSSNTIISATIFNDDAYTNMEIDNSFTNEITVDSMVINNVKNDLINNSIIILESNAYTFKLIGNYIDFIGLALYKEGEYKITFIDSLVRSFTIKVYISGNVGYKSIITDGILSVTQIYNLIYLNDIKNYEELIYNRDDLKALSERYVDICRYKYSSYNSYMLLVNKAKGVYLNQASQVKEINSIAIQLCEAYDLLIPSINKTRLYKELQLFEGLNRDLYVASTYDGYYDLYKEADLVFKADDITSFDVIKYSNELALKYSELVLRGDKSALKEKYNAVCDYKATDYTPNSYDNFIKTLDEAKEILNNIDATQNEIDTAMNTILLGESNLILRANYNELVGLFNLIDDISEWKYTTKSIQELKDNYDYAYKIYEAQNANQEYVNQIVLELNNCYMRLEKCGDETKLHDLVVKISKLEKAIYTSDTINPLLEKYNEANLIISERHSQDKIDLVENELSSLYKNLKIREDKEKLYYKLIELSKIDYTGISSQEMASFMKVYNSAYETLYLENATEDEINLAYDKLVKANEKLFDDLQIELVSPWVIIVVCLAALLALVLANNLMKEVFDCELVGLLILWIPSIIALPLLFIFTPFVGGIILLIEFGIIVLCMIIGILVDVNM